ncbi:MAG: PorV/PorQ family protein [Fidelibacterota bacterium]|nr:MAG: PorV/PorQ family protein [Candidatus Neomarinimicrobiota bacterium]
MKQSFLLSMMVMCAVVAVPLQAQTTTKTGTTTAQFLKIGPGARAAGMGESFSAIADDISAIFWNPAGLAHMSRNRLLASHIDWLADIDYDFFAAAFQVSGNSSVGAFATSVAVPEDEVRTVEQPDGTGERFSASDIAIGFSYARRISDRFSVGIVGKYIQERIWSMTSQSVALDIGTLYQSRWHNLRIGITLSNFGLPMKLAGRANLIFADAHPFIEGNIETIRAELEMEKWEIPLNVKTSIASDIISTQALKLSAALDMVHPNDNNEFFNGGVEARLLNMISLRTGYRGYGMKKAEGGFAFGAGLDLGLSQGLQVQVDYAVTDFGRLKDIHQFSVGFGF